MTFRLRLKTAAICLACAGASPAAADDGEVKVVTTNPTVLKVKPNGQDYTHIDLIGNFSVTGNLKFSAGYLGRIKSWQAELTMINGYGIATEVAGLGDFSLSESYPVFQRPKNINEPLPFVMPGSLVQGAAVGMCNARANELRKQGKSDKWIFDRHHNLHFDVWVEAEVDSNGAGSNNQLWQANTPAYEFKVRCMKWNGAQVPLYGAGELTNKPQRVWNAPVQINKRVRLQARQRVRR